MAQVPHNDNESAVNWLKRQVLSVVYVLMPVRAKHAVPFVLASLWRLVSPAPAVPNKASVFRHPQGYVGPVRDTSVVTLMEGMRRAFYFTAHSGPLKWWATSERAIMHIGNVRVAKRFRRTIRNSGFTVSIDTAFEEVVRACGAPRKNLSVTWLHPKNRAVFYQLFEAGFAHSVEVRDAEGALVGGVFGVQVGPVFSALSMFHTVNDASKLAIISLYQHLEAWGVEVVDHRELSGWVRDLGGHIIPQSEYEALLLDPDPDCAKPGRWSAVFTAHQTAEWSPTLSSTLKSGDEKPVSAAAQGIE